MVHSDLANLMSKLGGAKPFMPVTELLEEMRRLPAGREMDHRIATLVMALPSNSSIPPYSTDISAAWGIVEKMVRTEGVYFGAPHYKNKRQSLASLGYPEGTECWYCVLNAKVLNKVVICAETAALAICRTALLWVRSKEEPEAAQENTG